MFSIPTLIYNWYLKRKERKRRVRYGANFYLMPSGALVEQFYGFYFYRVRKTAIAKVRITMKDNSRFELKEVDRQPPRYWESKILAMQGRDAKGNKLNQNP